ncbi:MAG: hypothetical protein QXK02_03725, partial [Thermoplasmata archaeon]
MRSFVAIKVPPLESIEKMQRFFSEKYKIKLHLVLKVTMGERLPYLFMALIAFFIAPHNPHLAL